MINNFKTISSLFFFTFVLQVLTPGVKSSYQHHSPTEDRSFYLHKRGKHYLEFIYRFLMELLDTYAIVTSIPLMTFFHAVNALSWSSAAFRAVVRFICCRDSRNPDSYPYRVFPEYISIRPSGNSLWNWSYNADSWGMFSVFGCNSFIPLVTR